MRKAKILRIGVDLDACVVDLDLWVSRLIKKKIKKGKFVENWQEIDKIVQSVSHNIDRPTQSV